MVGVTVRFGMPSDASALAELESRFFPARAGQPHSGYVFAAPELAILLLTEGVAVPRHAFTLVAVRYDVIVGFAAARPFAYPGAGATDMSHMLLQYLAVDTAHRRHGVARELVTELEKRALEARQNVLVAHVSAGSAEFYRRVGWSVIPEGRGYAWLPFATHLHADIADPEIGYPLMAARVLRPKAIRLAFDFPIVHGRPMLDAGAELQRIVEAGTIDFGDLDGVTRATLQIARLGAPKDMLDYVDSRAKRLER